MWMIVQKGNASRDSTIQNTDGVLPLPKRYAQTAAPAVTRTKRPTCRNRKPRRVDRIHVGAACHVLDDGIHQLVGSEELTYQIDQFGFAARHVAQHTARHRRRVSTRRVDGRRRVA